MKSNGTKVVLVILTCIITCLIQAKNYERCELRKIFLKAFPPEQINDCESYFLAQVNITFVHIWPLVSVERMLLGVYVFESSLTLQHVWFEKLEVLLLSLRQMGVCLPFEKGSAIEKRLGCTTPKENINRISAVDEEHFLVSCWQYSLFGTQVLTTWWVSTVVSE